MTRAEKREAKKAEKRGQAPGAGGDGTGGGKRRKKERPGVLK